MSILQRYILGCELSLDSNEVNNDDYRQYCRENLPAYIVEFLQKCFNKAEVTARDGYLLDLVRMLPPGWCRIYKIYSVHHEFWDQTLRASEGSTIVLLPRERYDYTLWSRVPSITYRLTS